MFIYGTPWIFGLRREEPGRWKGGNIINPLNELSISTVLRFMRLTESGSKLIRLKCGMRSDWEWAEASSGLRVLSKNNNSGLNKMPNEIKYTACCFLLALSPFVFIVQN
jgi:hypothetical protein